MDGDVSTANNLFDIDSYQLPIFEPLKVLVDVKKRYVKKYEHRLSEAWRVVSQTASRDGMRQAVSE